MNAPTGTSHPVIRTRRVLDNGLVVLVLERRHLPIVSATLLLRAGVASEPEDHPGSSFFVSHLLPLGTRKRSAVALAEDVDSLGATLSAGCDADYATVEVTGLSTTACTLLDILAEVVLEATFLEEEVERKRTQILGILERRKDDYADVVRNRFFETIYGSHPYRRTKEGTPESVKQMTRDDLLFFHGDQYVPDGAVLALVGDVDAGESLDWVEDRFDAWRARDREPVPWPAVPQATERRIVTVQQELTQAYIRMGNVGIPRNHPDYHAAVVMNYILGGSGFGSRLMRNLREERGLAYGVFSNFWTRKDPGYFFVSTQTGTMTMNEAIAEILAEIDRFLDSGATEEELTRAKKYFTGSLPLTLETNDQLAQRLLEQEFYGLPDEFWLRDIERMQTVTAAEVLDVARRHIHPERFAVVVLGDFREHALHL